MAEYESGYIRKLASSLAEFDVPEDVVSKILDGGENINKKTSGEQRAKWMKECMRRMDSLLDAGTRHAVREACACCVGGQRHEVSKGIFKNHGTLEERIAAANEARFVFGHSVTREKDGSI